MSNLAIKTQQDHKTLDVLIVGAGPAGLSAAAQAKKAGLNYVLLEASSSIADTIQSFARGKWIMAEPITIPQRSVLSFKASSKENVIKSWQKEAAKQNLNIQFDSRVSGIKKHESGYEVLCEDQQAFLTEKLVLAFGIQGKPVSLAPELDPFGLASYRIPKDGAWENKSILIVGAGDSAVEEAMLLAEKNQVLLLNRKRGFDRCKKGNQTAIDAAIASKKVKCSYESEILELKPSPDGRCLVRIKTPQGVKRAIVDHVLARIGAHPPQRMLQELGLDLAFTEDGKLKADAYGETSLPSVFAAGAITGQPLIKQGMNQGVVCIERILGNHVYSTEMMMLAKALKAAGINKEANAFSRWLHSLSIFKVLDKTDVDELLMHAHVRKYTRDEVLIDNNAYSEDLYVVVEGEVVVTTSEGDKHIIQANETLGELTLLSKQASRMSASAKAGTIVLMLPQTGIGKLVDRNSDFRYALNKQFLKRVLAWVMLPSIPKHLLDLFLKQSLLNQYQAGEVIEPQNQRLFLVVNGSAAIHGDKGYKLVQGGGLIGFKEALSKNDLPSFEIKQANTVVWELPVSLIWGFKILNPELTAEHLNSNQSLVENPVPHTFGIVDPSRLNFFEQQNLGNAGNVLVIDKHKCVGCDQCEVACASTHNGVSRLNRKAGVRMDNLLIASACRHCKNPDCLKECPADAISRNASGEIVINDQCIGCGNCAGNCPYSVITLSEQKPKGLIGKIASSFGKSNEACQAVKCDLCVDRKSGPACVQACPTGAAQRVNPQMLIQAVNI